MDDSRWERSSSRTSSVVDLTDRQFLHDSDSTTSGNGYENVLKPLRSGSKFMEENYDIVKSPLPPIKSSKKDGNAKVDEIDNYNKSFLPETISQSNISKRNKSLRNTTMSKDNEEIFSVACQTDWSLIEEMKATERSQEKNDPVREVANKTKFAKESPFLQKTVNLQAHNNLMMTKDEFFMQDQLRDDEQKLFPFMIIDTSDSSEDESDELEEDYRIRTKKHKLLPSVGPPNILQYSRESDKLEESDVDLSEEDRISLLRGLFKGGVCEYCHQPVKPFPTLDEQQRQRPEELFCCNEYQEFVEFAVSSAFDRQTAEAGNLIGGSNCGDNLIGGSSLVDPNQKDSSHLRFGGSYEEKLRKYKSNSQWETIASKSREAFGMGKASARKKQEKSGRKTDWSTNSRVGDRRREEGKKRKGERKHSPDGYYRESKRGETSPSGYGSDTRRKRRDYDIEDERSRRRKLNRANRSNGGRDRSRDVGGGGDQGGAGRDGRRPRVGEGSSPREPGISGDQFVVLAGGDATAGESSEQFARQLRTINYQLSSKRCLDVGWTLRPLSPLSMNGDHKPKASQRAHHKKPGRRKDRDEAEIGEGRERVKQGTSNHFEASEDYLVDEDLPVDTTDVTGQSGDMFKSYAKAWDRLIIKYYSGGQLFAVVFADGTGSVYYPNGRVAITVSSASHGLYTYVAHDDDEASTVFAVFDTHGHGIVTDRLGIVRVTLDEHGGTHFLSTGEKRCKWLWKVGEQPWKEPDEHIHAPPIQPIVLSLSSHSAIRIMDQDNIILSFDCSRRHCHFQMGTRLQAKSSQSMGSLSLNKQETKLKTAIKSKIDATLLKISDLLRSYKRDSSPVISFRLSTMLESGLMTSQG